MMNIKLVLFLLISINAKFGVTKWNYISNCSFHKNDTLVLYECANSEKYIEKSDLSCCPLNCRLVHNYYLPKPVSLKFVKCNVAQLGIEIFETYPLIELDLSRMDLEILHPSDFHSATQLQTLNASHNHLTKIPTGIFSNTPKLVRVDFSFNRINCIDVFEQSLNASEVEIIDLSHNKISSIEDKAFVSLAALTELNLEHNLIEIIDANFFRENKNLKRFRFDGNRLKVFICSGHFIIYELNLSYNRLRYFNGNCVIYDSVRISVVQYENQESPLISRGKDRGDQEIGMVMLDEDDLSEMTTLNISNNQNAGIHRIIDRLREPLTSLDLTGNHLGTLRVHAFDKLINLEELVLRNTSLTTIRFGLFHYQKKLRLLDISYNNLKKIPFKVFSNLINLQSFYLDGNNLTDVNGLQKESFSKVRVLGISNNYFTCEYLVDFLIQWDDVELVKDELSNESHVKMIACDQSEATTQVQQKNDLHEQFFSNIYMASIIGCVFLGIMCIFAVFLITSSMWSIRKRKHVRLRKNNLYLAKSESCRRATKDDHHLFKTTL